MNQTFLDALTNNRTLSFEEISKKEEEFRGFSTDEHESLWEDLNNYFSTAQSPVDQKYWWSYFRWYTELSWNPLINRDQNFVINIAFPRQIIMAILLDINVWKELIWYLNTKPFKDEKEMSVFYSSIKNNFFKSTSGIGLWKNKPVTIVEIVKEITIANQQKNSLQIAEILSKLHEMLFPDNNSEIKKYLEKYIYITAEDAVSTFTDLVNFFLGVGEEKIWSIIDGAVHEEKFQLINEFLETPKKSSQKILSDNKALPLVSTNVPKPIIPTLSKPQTKLVTQTVVNSITKSTAISTRPSNKEIKQMIEASFSSGSGNTDYEGMVAMLNTLADRYKDDHIRELYFYNEKNSTFEWNEKLLR